MNPARIRALNNKEIHINKPVAYWMSRDQRVHDNWALLFASKRAESQSVPLYVFFALTNTFLGATHRQYDFMFRGLEEIERELERHNIHFRLIIDTPEEGIVKLTKEYDIGTLVTDFSPLRIGRMWREKISNQIDCIMYEVDAHNIVPCFEVSKKQEYAAYTIRGKINKLLGTFLEPYPLLSKHPNGITNKTNWEDIRSRMTYDASVKPVDWIIPGEKAASNQLSTFISKKLPTYDIARNNPKLQAQSDLSPYLHFGHISSQRIALEVAKSDVSSSAKEAFLEELIVRKELSDNFCLYNPHYDSYEGFTDWAKKSLTKHLSDTREYIYTKEEFEYGKTHDELWNDAEMEMVIKGKMHGYMRMYWAKKILEWTETPQDAMQIAIYLNDKYELDGRDPNGYAGIAWSIGGVHDRPWFDRAVYGQIRYMSGNSLKKKFKL